MHGAKGRGTGVFVFLFAPFHMVSCRNGCLMIQHIPSGQTLTRPRTTWFRHKKGITVARVQRMMDHVIGTTKNMILSHLTCCLGRLPLGSLSVLYGTVFYLYTAGLSVMVPIQPSMQVLTRMFFGLSLVWRRWGSSGDGESDEITGLVREPTAGMTDLKLQSLSDEASPRSMIAGKMRDESRKTREEWGVFFFFLYPHGHGFEGCWVCMRQEIPYRLGKGWSGGRMDMGMAKRRSRQRALFRTATQGKRGGQKLQSEQNQ